MKPATYEQMKATADQRAAEQGFRPGVRVLWNGRRTGKVATLGANAFFFDAEDPRLYVDVDAGPGAAKPAQLMLRASEMEILPAE
jgi:hypothetical protein